MQTDRVIKLVVGTPRTTFCISQNLLECTAEYFRAAFRYEQLGDAERGTLTFPDDDVTAWKVLIYWIMKRELPHEEVLGNYYATTEGIPRCHLLCIRCWALGDKYGIAAFQDLIMLDLLAVLDDNFKLDVREMKEALETTPPGSLLRDLVAEELAYELACGSKDLESLDVFNGVVGFSGALMQVVRCRKKVTMSMVRFRLPDSDAESWDGMSPYKKFMVDGGQGPIKHWLHNRMEDIAIRESRRA